ncbi:putative RNA pseudouridylate synthase domain-containing protein 1 [Apostichopus japonicus]|uniref:Putative RNA pseudouridylate synthase domain-containing protein 1 n=1 Tax=Stichopus japonicus TaxID=307972 RepID=A0A2G8KGU7_STIJA|nr:putative RNA pseudouridylate synthase domain-containing protein 1 [Apostichopus japonicus]
MYKPASLDDLVVIHKSSNFIVVNKHYDIKINSDDETDELTVANQLAKKFPDLVEEGLAHYFRFTHRLDYSTSGALCVALHKKASSSAQKMFQKREVQKEYLALVRGHMTVDRVIVERGICPNSEEGFTHMMCLSKDGESKDVKARSAKTEIVVLQRGFYDGDPATKLRLLPFTGRRHQLRLHCLSLGHPIVGDYTYSNRMDTKPYRMMLHSHKLHIPSNIEDIDATAPDPFTSEYDPKWVVDT